MTLYDVHWADGRVDRVEVDGRDWCHYELESGESCLPLLQAGGMREWWTGACAALRRAGRYSGEPAQFYAEAQWVVPVAAPVDPTSPPADSESSA